VNWILRTDEMYTFFLILVELVVDVYQLGEYIRKGDVDNAVELVKKLTDQGVRLQAKPWTDRLKEKKVQYVKKTFSFLLHINFTWQNPGENRQ
jgi:hypothetical protein